jgi:DNA processing protein
MTDETLNYLALSLIPGLGTTRIHQLVGQTNGAPSTLFKRSRAELKALALGPDITAWLSGGWALEAAQKTASETAEKGISIISLADSDYPQMLRSIYDPPVVLYCLGDARVAQGASVAIVGSRRASVYGRQVTQRLAKELAETGLVVISGLARGIDCSAHLGALEADGKTVAVLGCGVDVPYPRENRRVYDRIRERGCILSEFVCGAHPAPQNFPIRNRIISGLAYGTVIAEASEFSGSLITARLTLEQNRQLWAIPGNITSPGSYGPNYLIKQGARIVLDKQDVLEELPVYALDSLRVSPDLPESLPKPDLDPAEQAVFESLPVDAAIHFDVLLRKSSLSLTQLNDCLLRLQMKGLARQAPGRQYSRVLE